jgi:hypothetical protein
MGQLFWFPWNSIEMVIDRQSKKSSPGKSVRGWIVTFSIFLGLCLIPTIIGFPLRRTVFQPNFYLDILRQQQFFEQIPGLIATTIISPTIDESGNNTNLFSGLSQTQAELLVNTIIPAGWLEEQTNHLIAAGMDFVNLRSDNLAIQIDLQPLKDILNSATGQQVIAMVINGFPECSGDQINLILVGIQTGQSGLFFCNPPASDQPVLQYLLKPISSAVSSAIPSTLVFPTIRQTEQITMFTRSSGYWIYKYIRQSMDFLPWVSLILIMIIAISLRTRDRLLMGLGLPLIFAGIISAIPGICTILWSVQLSTGFANSYEKSGLPVFVELIQRIGQQVFLSVGLNVSIWSLGALIIGLFLIAIRLLLKK